MEHEPTEIRTDIPHSARIWNYWLGGKDNYAADRTVGDAMVAQFPDILVIARHSRQFLIRAVSYLAAEAGIDQFLDIGTGLPTMQNTHEVAQRHNPAARIVYVDNDPLVLAHARTLLVNTALSPGSPRLTSLRRRLPGSAFGPEGVTTYVHADVGEPEAILAEARHTLDLDRPVAVMLLGVLGHAAPEFDDMLSIINRLMAGVPSGSYLALLDGGSTSDAVREATDVNNYNLRTLDQFRLCFEGLDMVEPGLVQSPQWRPAPTDIGAPPHIDSYCAVGRKP